MMRGELKRFTQRSVQNAMSETNSKEFRAVLLALKLMQLSVDKLDELLGAKPGALQVPQKSPTNRKIDLEKSPTDSCVLQEGGNGKTGSVDGGEDEERGSKKSLCNYARL